MLPLAVLAAGNGCSSGSDENEAAEAKLERLKAEGKIASGDEYQLVQVPWVINELKGSATSPRAAAQSILLLIRQ